MPRLLLAGFCLALSLFFAAHPIRDFDIWWHLASGLWTLAHHQIPHADFFSYTNLGAPWVNHEWGASLIFAIVWKGLGPNGLILAKGLLCWGTLYFAGRSFQVIAKSDKVPLLMLFVMAYLLFPRLSERPHLFTTFFISYLLFCYYRHNSEYLWKIPLLFIVWTNLHWGALLGWTVLFLLWLGDRLKGQEKIKPQVVLLSFLALALNPFFLKVYTFPFEHLGLSGILSGTLEWRSPFERPWIEEYFYLGYALILAIASVFAFTIWRKTSLSVFLVFLVLAFLSVRHNRYTDLFILVVLPWVAFEISQRFPFVPYLRKGVLLVLLSLGTYFFSFGIPVSPFSDFKQQAGLGIDKPFDFFKSAQFLKKNYADQRIFHYFELGGYMMLEGLPVFIDGRTPVYGDAFFEDYIDALNQPDVFEGLREKWNFGAVYLLRHPVRPAPLTSYLQTNPSWRLVYSDDVALIFTSSSL